MDFFFADDLHDADLSAGIGRNRAGRGWEAGLSRQRSQVTLTTSGAVRSSRLLDAVADGFLPGFTPLDPALYPELFPTRTRVSGLAISQNLGTAATAMLPALFVAVAPPGSTSVPLTIGSITLAVTIVAAFGAWTARETYRIPIADLGNPDADPVPEEDYKRMRAHKWYMYGRQITVHDIYSFDPNVHVELDEFTDVIGRNFRQPEQGLGYDNSPVAHMWRAMIRPAKYL